MTSATPSSSGPAHAARLPAAPRPPSRFGPSASGAPGTSLRSDDYGGGSSRPSLDAPSPDGLTGPAAGAFGTPIFPAPLSSSLSRAPTWAAGADGPALQVLADAGRRSSGPSAFAAQPPSLAAAVTGWAEAPGDAPPPLPGGGGAAARGGGSVRGGRAALAAMAAEAEAEGGGGGGAGGQGLAAALAEAEEPPEGTPIGIITVRRSLVTTDNCSPCYQQHRSRQLMASICVAGAGAVVASAAVPCAPPMTQIEDVLEELIYNEIVDETDRFVDNERLGASCLRYCCMD